MPSRAATGPALKSTPHGRLTVPLQLRAISPVVPLRSTESGRARQLQAWVRRHEREHPICSYSPAGDVVLPARIAW